MQDILNNVKYLALRVLDSGKDTVGQNMQKILHPGIFYYFYDGVNITEENIIVKNLVPQDLFRIKPMMKKDIEINLCAIVGENGSGKSSVVDYIIRILNNLAAYILGENYRSPKAEHLHYIPHVFAELYILIEDNIFQIICHGDNIEVQPYTYEGGVKFEKRNTGLKFSGSSTTKEIISEHPELYKEISRLCYTIVVNYSLYAFNPDNYREESTLIRKESKIREIGHQYDSDIILYEAIRKESLESGDDRKIVSSVSWIQGLFHKNDGYQVPIVLNPFRENGNINLRSEYNLAKERLLSLVFKHDSVTSKRLFKTINRKLLIDGFVLKANNYKNKTCANVHKILSNYLPKLTKVGSSTLFAYIKASVIDEFKIPQEQEIALESEAWNYIVTKIIKITFTYSRYAAIRGSLLAITDQLSEDDKHNIREHLLNMWADHSHVTRKLYRTIYYLHFNIIGRKRSFKIETYLKSIWPKVGNNPDTNIFFPPHNADELLPPPIFDIDFLLYDINDIKQKSRIPFSSLSSGEKQVTYTLTSFYYHLMNLDSKHDVGTRVGGKNFKNIIPINKNVTPTNFCFKHVTLIFDEIELYFHPEMQRSFVANLLDGIGQLGLNNIRSIQVMMVTHSPFILSDIPKSNVLFLRKDGCPTREETMRTFGANIHHILKNSFFLQNGTMGLYAQNEINRIVREISFCRFCCQLDSIRKNNQDKNNIQRISLFKSSQMMLGLIPSILYKKDQMSDKEIISSGFELIINNCDYWEKMIDIIEEPIIHETLQRLFNEIKEYVDNKPKSPKSRRVY